MNEKERLNLKKMIGENDSEETTDLIRKTKHSDLIKADVENLNNIKRRYERLAKSNPNEFDMLCRSKCKFLFDNYTDIFNKVKKSEIDLKLLSQFLGILKQIEDGKLDQHEASYRVGSILKQIYVDSALQKEKNNEKRNKKHVKKPKQARHKDISWGEYKAKMQASQDVDV
jgi:hypothetical protein